MGFSYNDSYLHNFGDKIFIGKNTKKVVTFG